MKALCFVACGFAALSFACSSSSPTSGGSGDGPTDGAAANDATALTDAASSSDAPASDAGSFPIPDGESPDSAAIVAARPYQLNVPTGYDASKPTPLVVMFHGYSASGAHRTKSAVFRAAC